MTCIRSQRFTPIASVELSERQSMARHYFINNKAKFVTHCYRGLNISRCRCCPWVKDCPKVLTDCGI